MNRGQRPDNFYSGVGLDRADHLRRDELWLSARLGGDGARFVPVWRARSLVARGDTVEAVWLAGAAGAGLVARSAEAIFLGCNGATAYFALDVSEVEDPEAEPALAAAGRFEDLRAVGPLLARQDGAILAYARGLVHWHRRHRFCGVCGHPTHSALGGHVRHCANPECGAEHFPRTDPAVIMLVHDDERCVLGRQRAWPAGMHSTLAGFVEPGESLEEAVAREVREEVGLQVDEVLYHSSQPWPFPSSIMLGFQARARHAPLRVNPEELAAAGWYDRDALRASPESERFRLPRRDSIARRLIEDWLAGA